MTSAFQIKSLTTIEELGKIQLLERAVWQMEPIPVHQTLTAVKNGGIVVGAYQKGDLVGFSYGFPGYEKGQSYLCSHMLGIHPDYQHAGLGTMLKEAQREAALELGYRLIIWTFDPLESVNAYLNLSKLCGISSSYIENCYGTMTDTLNRGLPSDRLKLEWWIDSPHVREGSGLLDLAGTEGGDLMLSCSIRPDGLPRLNDFDQKKVRDQVTESARFKARILIPVPALFQKIKQEDLSLALDWRKKTRQLFQILFSEGYAAVHLQKVPDQAISHYVFAVKAGLPLKP